MNGKMRDDFRKTLMVADVFGEKEFTAKEYNDFRNKINKAFDDFCVEEDKWDRLEREAWAKKGYCKEFLEYAENRKNAQQKKFESEKNCWLTLQALRGMGFVQKTREEHFEITTEKGKVVNAYRNYFTIYPNTVQAIETLLNYMG